MAYSVGCSLYYCGSLMLRYDDGRKLAPDAPDFEYGGSTFFYVDLAFIAVGLLISL